MEKEKVVAKEDKKVKEKEKEKDKKIKTEVSVLLNKFIGRYMDS